MDQSGSEWIGMDRKGFAEESGGRVFEQVYDEARFCDHPLLGGRLPKSGFASPASNRIGRPIAIP